MIVFMDSGFHAGAGAPPNLKACRPYHRNDRMLVETVLSMQTVVNHFKKVGHRVWEYFEMHLAFALAAFNVLAQWHGLPADDNGSCRSPSPSSASDLIARVAPLVNYSALPARW